MFANIYKYVLDKVSHPYAERYLYVLSFCESSFFPIPPDVMLAPMSAVVPQNAIRFAVWTTVFSVLGGLLGYAIGFFFLSLIIEWLEQSSYWGSYLSAKALFEEWGGMAVLIAAVSPIPYKIFTISAGALEQNLFTFTVASIVGRGARFMLIALFLRWMGPKILPYIEKWIRVIGWSIVILFIILISWRYVL